MFPYADLKRFVPTKSAVIFFCLRAKVSTYSIQISCGTVLGSARKPSRSCSRPSTKILCHYLNRVRLLTSRLKHLGEQLALWLLLLRTKAHSLSDLGETDRKMLTFSRAKDVNLWPSHKRRKNTETSCAISKSAMIRRCTGPHSYSDA